MPGFLLDLDGTLYNGDQPIPYAAEFIRFLRERQYPFLFVTNNSSRTPAEVAEHLIRTGIEADEREVLTSAQAAAHYLGTLELPARLVYCIGERGLRLALEEAGFELLNEAETSRSAAAVVQGIDRALTYNKLLEAVSHIRNGAASILTNPDHLLPWNGVLTPGAGAIAASIEKASGVAPLVIGKPSPIIMQLAASRVGLAPSQLWTVGDNMLTDIRGGLDAGTRTALVLTGLVTEQTLEMHVEQAGVRPELVCRHLMELAGQFG
ncbi:HAD-IIA family hydrolase [Paenibacillus sp. YYML68]|uniref:HAD-IIA family hydrolase n=1 Tax=Paenibacillus sp. YYML68 TaxID=2909250 RepID=UPI0024905446|nr:HAD-IIA family hydrolase [Paenibacillus sp. YYML68]